MIVEHLAEPAMADHGILSRGGGDQEEGVPAVVATKPDLQPWAAEIADELVAEALASGLPVTHPKVEKTRLGGGNTAEVVAQLTLQASFAFKLDQTNKKLADEGEAMRKIRANELPTAHLPPSFCRAWPRIYAVRKEPPYAYLMEFFPEQDGWRIPGRPSLPSRQTLTSLAIRDSALDSGCARHPVQRFRGVGGPASQAQPDDRLRRPHPRACGGGCAARRPTCFTLAGS